jgi:hypothetical protein
MQQLSKPNSGNDLDVPLDTNSAIPSLGYSRHFPGQSLTPSASNNACEQSSGPRDTGT